MKRRLVVPFAALLLLSLAGLSCARVASPAEPEPGAIPTPVAQPPAAPHEVAGGSDCLACHARDEGFRASLKAGHPVPKPPGFTGSMDEACKLCHAAGLGHTKAKPLSHPVAGQEACLACHAGGVAGIPAAPPNHRSYAVEKCTLCHTPSVLQASSR